MDTMFNIGVRALRAQRASVLLHSFDTDYLDRLFTESDFTMGQRLPALPLYLHLVQSGDRTFQSLCRTATWLKRKIKDKDTTQAARRRMDETLSMVEFNIDYMKKHRKECDLFVQEIADALWDKGATVAEARGWN